MTQLLDIGGFVFDSANHGGVRVVVSGFKSKRKLTAAAGQGDDDGKLTRGGREPRELKITWDWDAGDEDANLRMAPVMAALDAAVPTTKQTTPLAFSYEEDGIDISGIKGVRLVEVESSDGPERDPASGVRKYEIACKSASKPTQKSGSTSKATDDAGRSTAWKDAPVKNPTAATKFDTVPTVKP